MIQREEKTQINSELVNWGISSKWEVVRMKFLLKSIQTGSTPSTNENDYYDGDINWFTPGDYTESKYLMSSQKQITNKAILDKEAKVLPKDTVVIVGIGATLGKIAILGQDASFNQQVTGLIANDLILPEFLYYWLHINKDTLIKTANYTTLPIINNQFIKEFRCVLPTISTQTQIVTFLNKKCNDVLNAIKSKENLIKLLEENRQSIITKVVTKGLYTNVKMKDSNVKWIGEIPEHWKKTRLDFIARVKARLGWKGLKAEEYVDEGYVFLSTPNLKGRNIDFENVNYITEERYFESPEIMLEVGDVLLAKDGSTLGITNVVRNLPNKATVNSSIAVLRPRECIDSVYFYYYLTSTYIQDTINQLKDGMGVPHLFQADIKKFPIILPPLEEQKEISKYLDKETEQVESVIVDIKQQIEKLKEYRQSLIYEAVTGKIDLRDYEVIE